MLKENVRVDRNSEVEETGKKGSQVVDVGCTERPSAKSRDLFGAHNDSGDDSNRIELGTRRWRSRIAGRRRSRIGWRMSSASRNVRWSPAGS